MKLLPVVTLMMALTLIFSACAAPPAQEVAQPEPTEVVEPEPTEVVEEAAEMAEMADIVDTAVAAGDFETLVAAVSAAGLVDTLKGEGPFTVFAPSDAAFAALPEGTVESLLEDPEGALTAILLLHVVPGKVMAADVVGMDGEMVETAGGGMVEIGASEDGVTVNGAKVVATDIETSNGVIHVIESVILPMEEAEMVEEEAAAEEMVEMADIVDTAIAAGGFDTLVAAVSAAGLVDTLKGEGPFTVFAPGDEAFAALPEGTVESLLEDPTGALTDILLFHVVPGKVMAEAVLGMDGEMVETAGGEMLEIGVTDAGVTVNGVNVVATDIETSNGVIHVIESVLIPAN